MPRSMQELSKLRIGEQRPGSGIRAARTAFNVPRLAASKAVGLLRSSGHTIPGTGVAIEDGTAIRGFLEAVRAYYRSAPSGGRECRFDYRLSYQSKEDYFDGREMFEAYFYPAGLHRVGGN